VNGSPGHGARRSRPFSGWLWRLDSDGPMGVISCRRAYSLLEEPHQAMSTTPSNASKARRNPPAAHVTTVHEAAAEGTHGRAIVAVCVSPCRGNRVRVPLHIRDSGLETAVANSARGSQRCSLVVSTLYSTLRSTWPQASPEVEAPAAKRVQGCADAQDLRCHEQQHHGARVGTQLKWIAAPDKPTTVTVAKQEWMFYKMRR